jgi:hypothetical protein
MTECATPNDYQTAINAIHVLLISGGWSSTTCNCPQQCQQTAFQMYPENIAFKPDHVKVRIFYDVRKFSNNIISLKAFFSVKTVF